MPKTPNSDLLEVLNRLRQRVAELEGQSRQATEIEGTSIDIVGEKKKSYDSHTIDSQPNTKLSGQAEPIFNTGELGQTVVENSQDYILVVDRNGLIKFINRVAPTQKIEDIIENITIFEHTDPAHHQRIAQALEIVFGRGESADYEIYCPANDTWFSNRISPIRRDNKVISAVIISQDVTHRKNIEQALKENEAKFCGCFESDLVGISIISPNRDWIDINQRHCQMLGYTREELLRKTWPEITHPDDLKQSIKLFERVRAGEIDEYSLEKRFIRKDQTVIHAGMHVKSVRLDNGSVDYFVSMIQEITDHNHSAQASRESESRQQAILDTALDYIMVLDLEGNLQFINRTVEGLTVEQVVGTSVYDYTIPEGRETVEQAIDYVKRTGESYQYEIESIGDHGRQAWYLCRMGPQIVDSEVKALTLCTTDITDRKLAEQATNEKQEQLDNLLSNIDAIILEGDPFDIYYVGGQVEKILGYPKEMWFAHSDGPVGFWFDLLHPDDKEKRDFCLEAIKKGQDHTFEYRLIAKNGKPVWFYDSVIVETLDGKPVKTRSVMVDITERKEAEQALRKSEERLREILDSLFGFVGLYTTDGILIEANQAPLDAAGLKKEDVLGKPFWDTYWWSYSSEVQDQLKETIRRAASGETVRYDVPVRVAEDRLIDIDVVFGPLFDTEGNISQLLGFAVDITDRKLAEQTSREKQNQLDNLLSNVDAIILEGDPFDIYYVGGQVEKILGFPKEMWFAHSDGPVGFWFDLLHPDDKRKSDTCLEAIKKGQDHTFEYRMIAKNGKPVWFYDSVIVETLDGKPVKTRSVMVDITERKEAEMALQESKERFRRLSEAAFEGILVHENGVLVTANDQFFDMFGRTEKELAGKQIIPILAAPESIDFLKKQMVDAAEGRFEAIGLRRDGSRFPLEYRARSMEYDGRSVRVVTIMDISERVQAVQALRKSEERLNLAIHGTSDGVWDVDIETGIDYWSPRFKELLGYKEDELEANYGQFLKLLHPEEKEEVLEAVRLHLEENQPYNIDFRMKMKSGEYRWFQSRGEALRDENGKPLRMAGSIRDVSDRKSMEESLLESQRYLSQAETMARIGHWRLNPETGEVTGSDELFRIFGLSRDEATLEAFLAAVHPEDREYDLYHIQRGIDFAENWDIEHRLLRNDGKIVFVQAIGNATVDESGKTVLLMGTVQDITARKQLEEEVRQHQDKLAHVSRLSTMGEMATGLAHELNQPLAAIANYCFAGEEILSNSDSPDLKHLQKIFEKLSRQSMRAGEIIRRLRNLVNKSQSVRTPVYIVEPIQEVLRLLETDLRQNEVHIELKNDTAQLDALIDEIQIQQVLVNLIRNAVDSMMETEHGRRVLMISTAPSDEDFIKISVSDTGKGIPTESADHVFDAFISTKSDGMGMGLAISRTIIESHGGSLWMTPNPDQGVTFHFTLPVSD